MADLSKYLVLPDDEPQLSQRTQRAVNKYLRIGEELGSMSERTRRAVSKYLILPGAEVQPSKQVQRASSKYLRSDDEPQLSQRTQRAASKYLRDTEQLTAYGAAFESGESYDTADDDVEQIQQYVNRKQLFADAWKDLEERQKAQQKRTTTTKRTTEQRRQRISESFNRRNMTEYTLSNGQRVWLHDQLLPDHKKALRAFEDKIR